MLQIYGSSSSHALHRASQFSTLLFRNIIHKHVCPLRHLITRIDELKFYETRSSRSKQNREKVVRRFGFVNFELSFQPVTAGMTSGSDASGHAEFGGPVLILALCPIACPVMLHKTDSVGLL